MQDSSSPTVAEKWCPQTTACLALVLISLCVILSVLSKITIPNFTWPERVFPALCLWLSLWFLSPAPHQKVPINNLKLPSYLSSWDPEAWCFSPSQSDFPVVVEDNDCWHHKPKLLYTKHLLKLLMFFSLVYRSPPLLSKEAVKIILHSYSFCIT